MCRLLPGRAAFMHFGSMLGTLMVLNVFFIIIPGQRELVKAAREGRPIDPSFGLRGKQRSVHNTYFTLPVVFAMISNHYAWIYGAQWNWVWLIAISAAGALVRVFFVARHRGRASPWPLLVAAALLAGTAYGVRPPPIAPPPPPSTPRVAAVVAPRLAAARNRGRRPPRNTDHARFHRRAHPLRANRRHRERRAEPPPLARAVHLSGGSALRRAGARRRGCGILPRRADAPRNDDG